MTGKEVVNYIISKYRERKDIVEDLVISALKYGITARAAAVDYNGGYFAIHVKSRSPVRFVIDEGTAKDIIAAAPDTVARPTPIRYDKNIATALPSKDVRKTQKQEIIMATPTKTRSGKAAVVETEEVIESEEVEELDDELEDEDEDEDELDGDLDLEDEDEDEDEDEEGEYEDEEQDEADEEAEINAEEVEESEGSDEPDYTPYASKPITATMQDFFDWMRFAIFEPLGEVIEEVDPVRLVAIAGTARMEFQRSEFNKTRRAERQAERESEKAAKARQPKAAPAAKPVAKGTAKPVAKGAKAPVAKGAAKPVAKGAKAPVAKAAATTTASKTAKVAAAGTRPATRKKGAAPY